MSSFLMNSGYSGVDPGKFPGSPSESEYSQSSYLGSHSDYYSHMQTAAAAQHYGYGASAAAAMSGYPNPRDPMGYSNYYQQCSAMTPQQVRRDRGREDMFFLSPSGAQGVASCVYLSVRRFGPVLSIFIVLPQIFKLFSQHTFLFCSERLITWVLLKSYL